MYGICDPTNFGKGEIKSGRDDLGVRLSMARVSAHMNLKPHLVGPLPHTTLIHHCVDLEVHRSQKDTKAYCLDFARVLPPEYPGGGADRGSHLKCLLRREFVAKWKTPLSSDSLSKFTEAGSRKDELDEVVEATRWLKNVLVPHFAAVVPDFLRDDDDEDALGIISSLIEKMHRCGLNLRLLGIIRVAMLEARGQTRLTTLILVEMVARVAKDDLNARFRKTTEKHKLPGVVKFEAAGESMRGAKYGGGTRIKATKRRSAANTPATRFVCR